MTRPLRNIALLVATALCSAPAAASETQNYTYDDLGRLVVVGYSGTVNNNQKHAVCYDPAGNRTQYKSDSANSGLNCTGAVAPSLSISNASITEGGILTFTITRNGDPAPAVSASYATASGSATTGSDFVATSGTVSFASGQTTVTKTVSTVDDTLIESSESMTMVLSNPIGGVSIANGTGTGTIVDNDTASNPSIVIGDAQGTEAQALVFTVSLSAPTSMTVNVNFATANGTATTLDYTATSGTLTFSPGQTSKTISVPTNTDNKVEANEIFYVNLTSPTNSTIGDAQGVGTIIDDGLGGGGGCPTC